MCRNDAYEIFPTSVVGSNYALPLRFAPGTLNVRKCFCWENICHFQVHDSLHFAEFAPQTRTSSDHMEPLPTWKCTCDHLLDSPFLASCTALELIHKLRNSRLSPSLSRNSAAQVVVVGLSQLSVS